MAKSAKLGMRIHAVEDVDFTVCEDVDGAEVTLTVYRLYIDNECIGDVPACAFSDGPGALIDAAEKYANAESVDAAKKQARRSWAGARWRVRGQLSLKLAARLRRDLESAGVVPHPDGACSM